MKNIVIYFVDDMMNIVYNNRVINIRLKDAISMGCVFNKNKFMEEFMKISKKEKFKSKLFGDTIYIIKNTFFNDRDLFFLENLFLELGFLKVIFIDIRKFFEIDDATYIEINDTYLVINIENGILINLNTFKNWTEIFKCLEKNINSNVILFGVNSILTKLFIKGKNVYYFENYKKYITDSLLNVEKYGA